MESTKILFVVVLSMLGQAYGQYMYTITNDKLLNIDWVMRYSADVDDVFSTTGSTFSTETVVKIDHPDQLFGLEANYYLKKIYVNSYTTENLYEYDVTTKKTRVVLTKMKGVNHLAQDYATGNMYYTDESDDGVWVADQDFKYQKKVIKVSSGTPTGVAVDVVNRKLIYAVHVSSDFGSRIYMSNLDGSGISLLYSAKGAVTSLMVHYGEKRVYWVTSDGLFSKVRSVDMKGRYPKTLLSELFSDFYDIAYYDDWIFVTDRDSVPGNANKYATHLIKNPPFGTAEVKRFTFTYEFAHNIAYYGPRSEFGSLRYKNECRYNSCEQLCLPSSTSYTCACDDIYEKDGNKCKLSFTFIFF